MNREVHVRICESPRGKFPRATRPTLQVLNEEGRKNQTKSYVWVIRGAPPGPKIVFFHYQPTRQAAFLQEWLRDYQGYIQTDGYQGYDFLDDKPKIVHLGCWAHARRKFADIVKSLGKRKRPGKKTHAELALDFIVELYKVEKKATALGLDEAERLAKRQQESKPIAKDFKKWLEELAPKALTGSLLGKAVNYTLGQWPRLVAYLETGFCALDTNGVENAIRPFVVGRKAWLFSGSPAGAAASAAMFTLTETAKACGWEPFAYFRFLFDHLPLATTHEEKRLLLPTIAKPTA